MRNPLQRWIMEAKVRVIRFTLVAKGLEPPILLMNRSKISPEQIKEAREETGGKVINEGFCYWRTTDDMVFQCKGSFNSKLKDQLRAIVLAEAKMLARVVVERGSSAPKHPSQTREAVEADEVGDEVEESSEAETEQD